MPYYTQEDFLRSIREHPDDDLRRLTFADWLEETETDVAWARFLRWGVANPEPLVFVVRMYNGPGGGYHGFTHEKANVQEHRWSPAYGGLPFLKTRGMAGFVRKHLPAPDNQTLHTGFMEKAIFQRGLLEFLAVPNRWWLWHGDEVVLKTGNLEVVTPHKFDAQMDDLPTLYDSPRPSGILPSGISQVSRKCQKYKGHRHPPGSPLEPQLLLSEEYPTVTFRISSIGK